MKIFVYFNFVYTGEPWQENMYDAKSIDLSLKLSHLPKKIQSDKYGRLSVTFRKQQMRPQTWTHYFRLQDSLETH